MKDFYRGDEIKTWPEIAQESGLPCGIVACPKCGKVAAGYLAPDLVCVCGYKFFERREEGYEDGPEQIHKS